MKCNYSNNFKIAAKAAGMNPSDFAKALRGLLSPSKCRNTKKIFSDDVLDGISSAR